MKQLFHMNKRFILCASPIGPRLNAQTEIGKTEKKRKICGKALKNYKIV